MANPETSLIQYSGVQAAAKASSLSAVAQHMFALMLRNMASAGFVFADPLYPGTFSVPGCIIASPSYPANLGTIDQDYVFNWTRDAAVTAIELVVANMPDPQPLIDYVNFANLCQNSGASIGYGCFPIEAQKRTSPIFRAKRWSSTSNHGHLASLASTRLGNPGDSPDSHRK